MKKIFTFILAAAALFAFAPVVSAQYTDSGKGLAYSKTISQPDTNGVYTITLESFATGTISITNSSKPVDLVLVLDVSSSMTADYGSTTRLAALKSACTAFVQSVYDKDAAARAADSNYAGHRIAIVPFCSDVRGTQYGYIGWTQVSTGLSDINTAINRLDTDRGTRPDTGLGEANSLLTTAEADASRSGSSKVVVLFTDGCPSESGSYTFDCGIAADVVNEALITKKSVANNGHAAKLFTVGLFDTSNTQWKTALTYENRYQSYQAANPYFYSYVLDYLNYTSSNFPDATATVATNPSSTTQVATGGGSGNEKVKINGQITYSNIGNGRTDANYSADGSSGYFRMASDDPSSLDSIFEDIASSSADAPLSADGSAVTEVDVVSSSFMLPPGADESSIKVYTAKCIGKEGEYLTFSPDTLIKGRTDKYEKLDSLHRPTGLYYDVDDSITVKLSASVAGSSKLDQIEVKGFDFSSNFCGPIVENGDTTGYRGNKLIVKIPIKMDSTAVGGPNCATNAPGSGIYINGEPLIEFESPKVSLPVNLHIRKTGLDVGESAKFTVYRATLPAEWKDSINFHTQAEYDALTWTSVSSVFVTRHEGQTAGSPITKIMGLPSTDKSNNRFIYKIVEDAWSWSYNMVSSSPAIPTSDNLVTNPFIFNNQKKDQIDIKVRHAESKATNTFKTGGGVTYDDSKDNGR